MTTGVLRARTARWYWAIWSRRAAIGTRGIWGTSRRGRGRRWVSRWCSSGTIYPPSTRPKNLTPLSTSSTVLFSLSSAEGADQGSRRGQHWGVIGQRRAGLPRVIDSVSWQGGKDQDAEAGGEGAVPEHEEGAGTDDEAVVENEEGNRGRGAQHQPYNQNHPTWDWTGYQQKRSDKPDAKIQDNDRLKQKDVSAYPGTLEPGVNANPVELIFEFKLQKYLQRLSALQKYNQWGWEIAG